MFIIINRDTISSLNRLLKIDATGDEQDWELEFADPSRIPEFVEILKTGNLTTDENYALTALLISSYDDHLENEPNDQNEYWSAIMTILDRDHHRSILEYWARLDENYNEYVFNVTPFVRKYLENGTDAPKQ